MNINELNDQELNRLEKLKKYQELGIDPFGQAYKVSHSIKEIRALCVKKNAAKLEKLDLHVSVAPGRRGRRRGCPLRWPS